MTDQEALLSSCQESGPTAAVHREVLLDYFSYNAAASDELSHLCRILDALAAAGHLVELSGAFEPDFCDQSAFENGSRFLFCLNESSRVTIDGLLMAIGNLEHFNELKQCLIALSAHANNDALFRYLLPSNFVTCASLRTDLHSTLLASRFDIFFSPTFQPKRSLVMDYIDRLEHQQQHCRDLVQRGCGPLLALAGFSQCNLERFATPSKMLRAALDAVRNRTVEEVLGSILRPLSPGGGGFQMKRLGQLIAFSLGRPALVDADERCGISGLLLRCCHGGVGDRVISKLVLRLPCNLLVVDEYLDGQPSVNLARLISTFRRDGATSGASLTDHRIYLAPYCSDAGARHQFFGDDAASLELFTAKQLASSSVRAVAIFVGATFASRLAAPPSSGVGDLERAMLSACARAGREVLLIMDDGVWPEAADAVLSGLVNKFVLPTEDAEADGIVWRNFLVRLANLPRPPPPAQHPLMQQQVV